jgi:hypothetical protein
LNYDGVAAHQSLGSFGHRRHLPGSLDPGMKAAEDEGWRGLVWRGYASIRQGGVKNRSVQRAALLAVDGGVSSRLSGCRSVPCAPACRAQAAWHRVSLPWRMARTG